MSMLGTFYYPWYGNAANLWRHWKEEGHNPPLSWASNFAPDLISGTYDSARQLYDSLDQQIIIRQLDLRKSAGIDFVISSWWGSGDNSDAAFKNLLDLSKIQYPTLKWCV